MRLRAAYGKSDPPKPVYAELVEALFFASCLSAQPQEEVQSFDKLRIVGLGEAIQVSCFPL